MASYKVPDEELKKIFETSRSSGYYFTIRLMAEIISEYRKTHNYSILEFSNLVGISRNALIRIEAGNLNTSFKTICKVLDYMDMHLEAIPNTRLTNTKQ